MDYRMGLPGKEPLYEVAVNRSYLNVREQRQNSYTKTRTQMSVSVPRDQVVNMP